MANILIVPAAAEGTEEVHLEFKGNVSMEIEEIPELGVTLVKVTDEDGEETVFENPAMYAYSGED
jgi:hypothetical protein